MTKAAVNEMVMGIVVTVVLKWQNVIPMRVKEGMVVVVVG